MRMGWYVVAAALAACQPAGAEAPATPSPGGDDQTAIAVQPTSSTRAIGDDWVARLGSPRPLRFEGADDARDLPGHVRAGSGLRRWGGRLVVVQDDVNALALFDERTGAVAPLVLPPGQGGRRHFSERRGNKAAKMDLEACVVLPDGRLLALGSGSTPAREHVVVVEADHEVRVVDAGPLYEHLRARRDFAGSELNVEGAVVVGDRVRLFQRGNGAVVDGVLAVNAVGDLALGPFLRWLDEGSPPPRLRAVQPVALGEVRGVPLGFTDASALPDGRILFLAGAEDSPDTYRDGAVLGARVGLLDGDRVVLAAIVDAAGRPTSLKLEGVAFEGFTEVGGLELRVVADMDDPDLPAVIATLHWGPR